jgi:hypothetical protein
LVYRRGEPAIGLSQALDGRDGLGTSDRRRDLVLVAGRGHISTDMSGMIEGL